MLSFAQGKRASPLSSCIKSDPSHNYLNENSTDYDAWRVGAEPVTVEEVMKTLHTNASLSKHITSSILAAVHNAVASGTVLSKAKGGMKWSLMTNQSVVSEEEKYKLKYILPEYFADARAPVN